MTHQVDPASRLIQFWQGIRLSGQDSMYAYWNHCAIYVGGDILVEAAISGVRQVPVNTYDQDDHAWVDVDLRHNGRARASSFAAARVGLRYDWISIAFVAVRLATRGRLNVGFDDRYICSGLVGEALEHGGYDFPRDGRAMSPSDLAQYFKIPKYVGAKT